MGLSSLKDGLEPLVRISSLSPLSLSPFFLLFLLFLSFDGWTDRSFFPPSLFSNFRSSDSRAPRVFALRERDRSLNRGTDFSRSHQRSNKSAVRIARHLSPLLYRKMEHEISSTTIVVSLPNDDIYIYISNLPVPDPSSLELIISFVHCVLNYGLNFERSRKSGLAI